MDDTYVRNSVKRESHIPKTPPPNLYTTFEKNCTGIRK